MTHNQTNTNRSVIGLLAVAALCAGGYAIKHTVSCFLLAFVLAYLFDPLVVWFESRRLKRIYGIILFYCLLGVFSLFCMIFLVPLLTIRWESLLKNLPLYLQKGKEIVFDWKEHFQPVY